AHDTDDDEERVVGSPLPRRSLHQRSPRGRFVRPVAPAGLATLDGDLRGIVADEIRRVDDDATDGAWQSEPDDRAVVFRCPVPPRLPAVVDLPLGPECLRGEGRRLGSDQVFTRGEELICRADNAATEPPRRQVGKSREITHRSSRKAGALWAGCRWCARPAATSLAPDR